MTLLGIDFGRRHVGLARATADGRIAAPWKVLPVRGREDALAQLVALLRRESVQRAVMGLPRNADGTEGSPARRVRRLARVLARRTGVPVVLQDEYASTIEAAERVGGRKGRLDAAAAAVILQAYLDAEKTTT